MFVHLTTHSAYSLQEVLLSPSELVQPAQAQGMTALGLTDHHLLTGSVEFVHACKEAGIQPILGLEIDLENGKISLLATSTEGWSNQCQLSSALALQDDPEAPCSLEVLENHSNDLIALSDTQGDNTGQRLGQIKDAFGNRLYLTLQNLSKGLPLSSLARRMNISMVVTYPVYYLTPDWDFWPSIASKE
jgi:DNA polymerase-3 subunit alpha